MFSDLGNDVLFYFSGGDLVERKKLVMHERKGMLALMEGEGAQGPDGGLGHRWAGNAELPAFRWPWWWEDRAVGWVVPMFSMKDSLR